MTGFEMLQPTHLGSYQPTEFSDSLVDILLKRRTGLKVDILLKRRTGLKVDILLKRRKA